LSIKVGDPMRNLARLKWSLPVVAAAVAVAVGFVLVSPLMAIKVVRFGGYYVILAAFAAFSVALVRELRTGGIRWTSADWWMVGAGLAVTSIWQAQEIHGFKILMDELVLNVTSQSMHFDREVFTPLKAHDVDGLHLVLGGILDKRPLFFPFLVSVLHDLTGFRPENAFVLNGVLAPLLLLLAGRLGCLLGGSTAAGIVTILLLAGVPLVGLSATGGGFDLLNLVMICACALLSIRFLNAPTRLSQDALVLGAVLLAQTRYESAIFVPVAGLVLVAGWWSLRRVVFSWGLVAAPLLLVTIPLQNKLFALSPGYWSVGLTDDPFHTKYFFENVGHAVNFLFKVDEFQSGSLPLSIVGLVSLPFALLFVLRRWRATLARGEQFVFAVFAAAILANLALLLCYFWGQLDDFMATRLALPLLLLFALAGAFVFGRWFKEPLPWRMAGGAAISWFWLWGVPFASRALGTNAFLTYQQLRWERGIIEQTPDSVFFASESALTAMIDRRPGMAITMLAERAPETAFHLRAGTYRDVYVFQRLQYDPDSGAMVPVEECRLGPEFVLETIEEVAFKPLYHGRVSRVAAVDSTRAEPRPPGWKPIFPPFQIVPEPDETPTGAYLRRYLQMLP
jgi:hypothetical protein